MQEAEPVVQDRAGLIVLRPFIGDADCAYGHQQTLAARGPSRR